MISFRLLGRLFSLLAISLLWGAYWYYTRSQAESVPSLVEEWPEINASLGDKGFLFFSRKDWNSNEDILIDHEGVAPRSRLPEEDWATSKQRPVRSERVLRDSQRRLYKWPLEYSPAIEKVVVHHTGEYLSSRADGATVVRAIFNYHTKVLGWGDIGYNYLIDKQGNIYEGRRGGHRVIGAHTAFYNLGTVGVAVMGNFNTDKPTDLQIESLSQLLGYLSYHYKIDLKARSEFLGIDSPNLTTHRDVTRPGYATSCPGEKLLAYMDWLRKRGDDLAQELGVLEKDGRDFLAKSQSAKHLTSRTIKRPYEEVQQIPHYNLAEFVVPVYQRFREYELALTLENNSSQPWLKKTTFTAQNIPEGVEISSFVVESTTKKNETARLVAQVKVLDIPNGQYRLKLEPDFELLRSPLYKKSELEIDFRVAGDAGIFSRTPELSARLQTNSFSSNSHQGSRTQTAASRAEVIPNIRVRLRELDSKTLHITSSGTMELWDNNQKVADIPPRERLSVYRPQNNNGFLIKTYEEQWQLTRPEVRTNRVFTIENWDNLRDGQNYNQFRNTLRFIRRPDEEHWVVNELPLEWYLQGIADELSGESPVIRKSVAVLWRSRAHQLFRENQDKPFYDVSNDEQSLPYWGERWAHYHAHQKSFIDETRGQGIMIENQPTSASYQTPRTSYKRNQEVFTLRSASAFLPTVAGDYQSLLKKFFPHIELNSLYKPQRVASR